MNESIYREKIMENFKNPLNYGKIKNPTNTFTGFNPSCGDKITIYLNIENKKIKNIGFESQACAVCTASASLITEKVKNQNIEKIKKMNLVEIEKIMGMKIIATRIKCALLPLESIKGALGNA